MYQAVKSVTPVVSDTKPYYYCRHCSAAICCRLCTHVDRKEKPENPTVFLDTHAGPSRTLKQKLSPQAKQSRFPREIETAEGGALHEELATADNAGIRLRGDAVRLKMPDRGIKIFREFLDAEDCTDCRCPCVHTKISGSKERGARPQGCRCAGNDAAAEPVRASVSRALATPQRRCQRLVVGGAVSCVEFQTHFVVTVCTTLSSFALLGHWCDQQRKKEATSSGRRQPLHHNYTNHRAADAEIRGG